MSIFTRAALIRPLAAIQHRRHHPALHEQEPPSWLTGAALCALALALAALCVAVLMP